MTIRNKLDNRQSRQREKLDQVSEDLDLRLDSILNLINDELTPPIRLRADTPATRVIYVDSNIVQTFDSTNSTGHKRNRSIPPFQDKIPTFSGGSFTIPTTSGGPIVAAGSILDSSYTLTITNGNFRKMILSLNSSGKIVLSFGVESTVEATATLPALSSAAFPIGMIVLKNEGGTIRTVSNEHIYQFTGNTNSGADANIIRVTKNNHAFVVGEVLYLDSSGIYQKANASASNLSNVVGMVSKVVDVNTFELTTDGQVSNIGVGSTEGALVAGTKYFLSTTNGRMSVSAPTVVGQMSVELGTAIDATTFAISPKLGLTVGQVNLLPNLRTQIVLNGSAASSQTTLIQNVVNYEAGEVVGWVYANANTKYRFYIQAQFTKNAAGDNFNISYQTSGETPPAGFSMNITAGGNINIVLPALAGWVSGYLVYALNAPALGTSFPLAINQSSVNSNYRETSVSTTLTDSDYMVVATGSSSLVVTLPALSGSGKNYVIKSLLTSGAVTVQTTGGALIDGSGTSRSLEQFDYLKLTSGSSSWSDVSSKIYGASPVGTIIAIGDAGAWALPASGAIKDGWALCNGQAKPTGSAVGISANLPNLTDDRFLNGSTAAGASGGSTSKTTAGSGARLKKDQLTTGQNNHNHNMNHRHSWLDYPAPGYAGSWDGGNSRYYYSDEPTTSNLVTSQSFGGTGKVGVAGSGSYNISATYLNDLSGDYYGSTFLVTGEPLSATSPGTYYTSSGFSGFTKNYNLNTGDSTSTWQTYNAGTASTYVDLIMTEGTIADIRPKYLNVVYVMRVK